MSLVTVRLDDRLMHVVTEKAQVLHVSKTEYIRRAIEQMNANIANQERKKSLIQASLRVRNESMRVNDEFSGIEYDPEI